jgi:hypothetical protein
MGLWELNTMRTIMLAKEAATLGSTWMGTNIHTLMEVDGETSRHNKGVEDMVELTDLGLFCRE